MIATFLSVLKSKKNFSAALKKFYELYLIKKSNFDKPKYIDFRKITLGIKRHYFFQKQKISYSNYLKDSVYISFLKEIDGNKRPHKTKYYKLMEKYGGKNFARKRINSFIDMYTAAKNKESFKPIHVYKDLKEWQGFFPDFPVKKKKLKEVAQKTTYMIFDGHHRAAILMHLGNRKIPVRFIQKDFLASIIKKI